MEPSYLQMNAPIILSSWQFKIQYLACLYQILISTVY